MSHTPYAKRVLLFYDTTTLVIIFNIYIGIYMLRSFKGYIKIAFGIGFLDLKKYGSYIIYFKCHFRTSFSSVIKYYNILI